MKYALAVACICVLVLSSCATASTVYQSSAPEVRGERAISSNIELIKEVALDNGFILGVFYSHEVYASGDAQLVLFTLRPGVSLGAKAGQGTMDLYDLSNPSSLSVDQARKLSGAIDNYLAMDPKSLTPAKMYNFELYSGTLDMTVGNDKYRPFRNLTFVVICSVRNSGKSFKTEFPQSSKDLYGRPILSFATFDLGTEQVQRLRDAIGAALDKSVPPAAPLESKSGT